MTAWYPLLHIFIIILFLIILDALIDDVCFRFIVAFIFVH